MDSAEARASSYDVLERFLAGYWTSRTRVIYRFILTAWLDSYHEHGYDPVGCSRRRSGRPGAAEPAAPPRTRRG